MQQLLSQRNLTQASVLHVGWESTVNSSMGESRVLTQLLQAQKHQQVVQVWALTCMSIWSQMTCLAMPAGLP